MWGGCDPELKLRLGSGDYSPSADSDSSKSTSVSDWFGNATTINHRQPQVTHQPLQQRRQQLAMFYDGRICVCDATEIQAKAIICMAMREVGERSPPSQPPSPMESIAPEQLTNPAMSMRRSLQRFLQKRKTRMNAASPYNAARSP